MPTPESEIVQIVFTLLAPDVSKGFDSVELVALHKNGTLSRISINGFRAVQVPITLNIVEP